MQVKTVIIAYMRYDTIYNNARKCVMISFMCIVSIRLYDVCMYVAMPFVNCAIVQCAMCWAKQIARYRCRRRCRRHLYGKWQMTNAILV